MSFPSKSLQIMCITSSVAVMTSSVVVMTSSVAMVIPGHGLNCDNKIAAKIPIQILNLNFPYERVCFM